MDPSQKLFLDEIQKRFAAHFDRMERKFDGLERKLDAGQKCVIPLPPPGVTPAPTPSPAAAGGANRFRLDTDDPKLDSEVGFSLEVPFEQDAVQDLVSAPCPLQRAPLRPPLLRRQRRAPLRPPLLRQPLRAHRRSIRLHQPWQAHPRRRPRRAPPRQPRLRRPRRAPLRRRGRPPRLLLRVRGRRPRLRARARPLQPRVVLRRARITSCSASTVVSLAPIDERSSEVGNSDPHPERRAVIVRAEGLGASGRVFVGVNIQQFHNDSATDDPDLLRCVCLDPVQCVLRATGLGGYDRSLDDDPEYDCAHFAVALDHAVIRGQQSLAAAAALHADAIGAAGGGLSAWVVAVAPAQTNCSTVCPAGERCFADVPIGTLWVEEKLRGGTCTNAHPDPLDAVEHSAKHLVHGNDFADQLGRGEEALCGDALQLCVSLTRTDVVPMALTQLPTDRSAYILTNMNIVLLDGLLLAMAANGSRLMVLTVHTAEAAPMSSSTSSLPGACASIPSLAMLSSTSLEHASLSARQVFEELSLHADIFCNNCIGFELPSCRSLGVNQHKPWPPPYVQVEFECGSTAIRPSPWPSFLLRNRGAMGSGVSPTPPSPLQPRQNIRCVPATATPEFLTCMMVISESIVACGLILKIAQQKCGVNCWCFLFDGSQLTDIGENSECLVLAGTCPDQASVYMASGNYMIMPGQSDDIDVVGLPMRQALFSDSTQLRPLPWPSFSTYAASVRLNAFLSVVVHEFGMSWGLHAEIRPVSSMVLLLSIFGHSANISALDGPVTLVGILDWCRFPRCFLLMSSNWPVKRKRRLFGVSVVLNLEGSSNMNMLTFELHSILMQLIKYAAVHFLPSALNSILASLKGGNHLKLAVLVLVYKFYSSSMLLHKFTATIQVPPVGVMRVLVEINYLAQEEFQFISKIQQQLVSTIIQKMIDSSCNLLALVDLIDEGYCQDILITVHWQLLALVEFTDDALNDVVDDDTYEDYEHEAKATDLAKSTMQHVVAPPAPPKDTGRIEMQQNKKQPMIPQFSWDPGNSDLLHRLGGKPKLKKGGMSGMDGPWALALSSIVWTWIAGRHLQERRSSNRERHRINYTET